MGERELREKYGGKLAKAINRAIRAECPGGNDALDKLTHLAAAVLQPGWEDNHGNPTPEAAAYLKHKRQVVDKLEALIREKWGIPKDAGSKAKPRRRSGGSDQADRKPAKAFRRKPRAGGR